ncbi:hypothetical protein [Kocuria sp. ZOR0020]|uniref:hypothetical protein n=1 Tax=Kocuria sp. ZOR0020 TaxID=1339234 RepID=UPI0006463BBA|nr:hypothetical protein [Kocuria sp. ZOR0020]
MSAFDEIGRRGDAAGPKTLALLRRLGAQVTRSSSYPPPEGYDSWCDEAVDDLLADMFVKNPARGRVFVLACFVKATGQASLERLLLATIGNFLKDQAKSTERGKLRRRLDTILGEDGRFVRPPISKTVQAWALSDGPAALWQGDIDQLHRAAARVRGYQILTWNTAGKTPAKNITAISAVSYVVIDDADGSVRDEDLARVIETRFVLISPPVFIELPDGRFTEPDGLDHGRDDEDLADPALIAEDSTAEAEVAERARGIWSTLSVQERALLPCLGASIAVRCTVTGLGRATAQALTDSLVERLRMATVDDDERDAVVLMLAQMGGGAQ